MAEGAAPAVRLERCTRAFASYCGSYPAFLDSSQALMRRRARELHDIVSDGVWLRLGQSMARCLGGLSGVLRDGIEAGGVPPGRRGLANVLWTQGPG